MTKPKKRGPGRPKGSKTKKHGPKPAKPASRARAPKKALSRAPAKAPTKVVDLVAGKCVIAVFNALLLKGDGSPIFNTPQFSNDHAREFSDFQVFDSKPDAVLALQGIREKYGAVVRKPVAAESESVDLSFLDEPESAPTPEQVFDTVPGQTDSDLAVEAALGLHPAPIPTLAADPALVAALTAAVVEPAKTYFATSYTVVEGNTLSKRVTWKEKATSLVTAVKAVKVKLDEQVGQFKLHLKSFDTKVAVKRKELESDVHDAEKIRDDFVRLAKSYA